MNEAAFTKDEAQTDPDESLVTALRHVNILSIVGLLLVAVVVTTVAWAIWQFRSLQASSQQQLDQLIALNDRSQSLKHTQQQLTSRLAHLPTEDELERLCRLISHLQVYQKRLSQRMETVLGSSQHDLRMAEDEGHIRLPRLRLSALQDINITRSLIKLDDEIIRKNRKPGAYATRDQLTKNLYDLRITEQPDRTSLYLQLESMCDQVVRLSAIPPEYQLAGESSKG